MKNLFDEEYDRASPDWVVAAYFNWMYDYGYFLDVVEALTKRWGFATDDFSCDFPDTDSYYEEDHFDGVKFVFGAAFDPEVVIVSEDECFQRLSEACDSYLRLHPEDSDQVRRALLRLTTS
jgi:hypothetical protein